MLLYAQHCSCHLALKTGNVSSMGTHVDTHPMGWDDLSGPINDFLAGPHYKSIHCVVARSSIGFVTALII